MNKKRSLALVAVATFTLAGCMGNGYGQRGVQNQSTNHTTTPVYTTTTNNRVVSNSAIGHSLAYMYDEERLAKELYEAIYQRQPVKQLTNIASKAEGRHIDAVKDMAQRYGVATPYQQAGHYQTAAIQSLFNQLYAKGIRSQKDALEVGCIVEVTDVDDLNNYMNDARQANAQDLLETYDFLRKGSYNHYWSFDKGLKQIGVSNGCCSLGQKYCHPEYPQNEKEGHSGNGRGQGGGRGWR